GSVLLLFIVVDAHLVEASQLLSYPSLSLVSPRSNTSFIVGRKGEASVLLED
ncbi:unnamed protein product, partial [Amoebophrya sp. A25]